MSRTDKVVEGLNLLQAIAHAVGQRTPLDEALEWAADENNWKDSPGYTAEELIAKLRLESDDKASHD